MKTRTLKPESNILRHESKYHTVLYDVSTTEKYKDALACIFMLNKDFGCYEHLENPDLSSEKEELQEASEMLAVVKRESKKQELENTIKRLRRQIFQLEEEVELYKQAKSLDGLSLESFILGRRKHEYEEVSFLHLTNPTEELKEYEIKE